LKAANLQELLPARQEFPESVLFCHLLQARLAISQPAV
jgi:hypothetical protein